MTTTTADKTLNKITEHVSDLADDGWSHDRQPIGLMQAIQYAPSRKLDGRPSGKPSSKTPLSRKDALRIECEQMIKRLHKEAMTEVHGPDHRQLHVSPLRHLEVLAPHMSRDSQRNLEKQLGSLVYKCLIALEEVRPDKLIRDRSVFCPMHEDAEPPLYLRANPYGDDSSATVVCHKCTAKWTIAELGWLGRLMESA